MWCTCYTSGATGRKIKGNDIPSVTRQRQYGTHSLEPSTFTLLPPATLFIALCRDASPTRLPPSLRPRCTVPDQQPQILTLISIRVPAVMSVTSVTLIQLTAAYRNMASCRSAMTAPHRPTCGRRKHGRRGNAGCEGGERGRGGSATLVLRRELIAFVWCRRRRS